MAYAMYVTTRNETFDLAPEAPGTTTISTRAMDSLRSEILMGRLPPGERLKANEVRVRLGVSVGVAREALMRLAEQDLVRSEDNRGFSVRPIRADELVQLTSARVLIEGEALRLAVERADMRWQGHVLALQHQLSRTPEHFETGHGVSLDWTERHLAFHAALIAGSGNTVLTGIGERLQRAAQVYPSWAVSASKARHTASEHQGIVDAVLAGDASTAVTRYCDHIQLTTQHLLQALESGEIQETPRGRQR